MQHTIKYFGMLVEATSKNEEQLQTEICSVAQLIQQLEHRYPKLNEKNFKVAIDQQLVDNDFIIKDRAEIALLPPFAGG
ncbi:MoaD/ThiS family protein [Aquimarina algicola]|uniref:Molybdopterin synthase sulfur carrier subunit n=1 Tax=Aquimarina algicola TaxID=2589995 RepID=A0A504JL17_9FLAO|nr:MoaD/ThiS family protein [Aquimarina algicola]TPN87449.1 MoaD/ThiS family protein [Aquimarina algicola]